MEPLPQKTIPILETAWTRFGQLDAAALKRSGAHLQMRFWIAFLGVLAALFAILTQIFPTASWGLVGFGFKLALIMTPLIASVLAALATKYFSGGDWLIKRAGAEEILKEIYMFRTVLQKSPKRRAWLENRLAEIQRQVFRSLGGELTMNPYDGQLPPTYDPEDQYSDPGFNDLTGEEYFQYRLIPQLAWHIKEINEYQRERSRLQVLILLLGAAGAILAAFDQTALWVALTASLTAAFIGWQQLRNIDSIIRNYSKVVMELEIIYNHWTNLEAEERSPAEFFMMVKSCEEILWSQNMEYIKSQQEALKDASLEEEAGLINRVIREAVEADARLKRSMAESMEAFTLEAIHKSEAAALDTFNNALHTLAEEASSEIVQAELDAMGEAIVVAAQDAMETVSSRFNKILQEIADDFNDVEIGRDTPPTVLNQILSRYPKSDEVKG